MKAPENTGDQLAPIFQKRPTNYQPNLFTESKQEFTELEKKIVTLVVNQIGHMSLKGDLVLDSNIIFNVPFGELTKNNYKQIADAAESIQSKRLMYRNDDKKEFHYITPFPSVKSTVVDGRKVVELTMFSAVVPHFAELGKRYTKYDIDVMLSLSSIYSQRMFEIVSMYCSKKKYQFSYDVDQLMGILNCPEQYTFNDFRRNALLVAQRELEEKANLILDWIPKKIGKRIVSLDFCIKTTQQLATEGVKQDQQMINKMSINEAYAAAWRLLANYSLKNWQKDLIISEHNLLEIFFRVDSELTNGLRPTVKNHTAYLIKSLGIDQMKAPLSEKPVKPKARTSANSTPSLFAPGPTVRTGAAQSLGSILSGMNFPKSDT